MLFQNILCTFLGHKADKTVLAMTKQEFWNKGCYGGGIMETCNRNGNYIMEQVAAMFDKKLNEEFSIKYGGRRYKAYFKKSGIRVHALYYMNWDSVLVGLLTGEVTIING